MWVDFVITVYQLLSISIHFKTIGALVVDLYLSKKVRAKAFELHQKVYDSCTMR